VSALKTAEKVQIYKELLQSEITVDFSEIYDISNALELATPDLILERFEEDKSKLKLMRECAADAFKLVRVLPLPEDPINASYQLLRMSSLAILGDRGSDAARLLKQLNWPALPYDSDDWGKQTWSTITDIWLRLIRKKGWEDRDFILQRVADLRSQQTHFDRALVNQITRQLRSDFDPLSVIVEKVSPALEVDSVEMDLLKEQPAKQKFRVLVTTPRKVWRILEGLDG
jgi:hypothetical protein